MKRSNALFAGSFACLLLSAGAANAQYVVYSGGYKHSFLHHKVGVVPVGFAPIGMVGAPMMVTQLVPVPDCTLFATVDETGCPLVPKVYPPIVPPVVFAT